MDVAMRDGLSGGLAFIYADIKSANVEIFPQDVLLGQSEDLRVGICFWST